MRSTAGQTNLSLTFQQEKINTQGLGHSRVGGGGTQLIDFSNTEAQCIETRTHSIPSQRDFENCEGFLYFQLSMHAQ